MSQHSSFFQRVYEVTRKIPYGRVSTYGAIANYLGAPGAARMVGWAMNQSGSAIPFVPAHRVVNRVGLLTGKHHFEGSGLMQELLENEGAIIENNQIVFAWGIFFRVNKTIHTTIFHYGRYRQYHGTGTIIQDRIGHGNKIITAKYDGRIRQVYTACIHIFQWYARNQFAIDFYDHARR